MSSPQCIQMTPNFSGGSLLRFLSCFVILGTWAWGQAVSGTAPLVANGSLSPNPVGALTTSAVRPALLPPLPTGKITLLGGTISSVDHIRDRIVLEVFGGGRYAVLFDDRTRVFVQGKQQPVDTLRAGQRAYVDTTLDGDAIFARNIRLDGALPTGEGTGQIVSFDARNGELTLRDTLDPQPVKLRLAPGASILRDGHSAQPSELHSGTLVNVTFTSAGDKATIRELSILASPGDGFVFSGRVQFLDRRRGLLVIVDPRDNKSYEVYFNPSADAQLHDVQEGTEITATTNFDGRRYLVQSITPNPSVKQSP
jgi:hypothetical protein